MRLEVNFFVVFQNIYERFQFLFGAIGSIMASVTLLPFFLFQFLFGAIGSGINLTNYEGFTLFQFLFGAIGSFFGQALTVAIVDFNSSLVRLEDIVIVFTALCLVYFNSSLVRLEVLKGY